MSLHIAASRTALFTPAIRDDRFDKALSGAADAVILDLEDAVAARDKDRARQNVVTRLSTADSQAFSVRINTLDTPEGQEDLAALVAAVGRAETSALQSVVLPKAESEADIEALSAALPEPVMLIPLIETASGVLNSVALAKLDRVGRLGLGALDLALDLDCAQDSSTMGAARAQLVLASRAAGIVGPIDTPSAGFTDLDEVFRDAARAKADGFTGKLCIHPAQVNTVHEVFTPTAEEVEWAKSVVAVGDGVGSVNGQMVDRPVLQRAQRVLQRADPGHEG